MKACPACNSRYQDEVVYCTKDGNPVVADQAASTQAADADKLIGTVIAERFRLLRKLGEGGMGEVYEAEHVHIEKRVAIKLLRPEILSNQEAVSRFKQEARSASSIGHDNIIEIEDFGTLPDGRVYLAMEFLAGAPLSDLLKQPMDPGRALDILIQTTRGLAAAHAKGIIHRDMKPENIYVTVDRDGREVPKLLDFGIAKVSGTDENQNLTRTGTIFGTPFYMAPEQALGQKIDGRADIYAMGVIMYEVFTGSVPFKAESFMGILTQHITNQPEPPAVRAGQNGRAFPAELEGVIMCALAKDPASRFQSMNDLDHALTAVRRALVGPGMTGRMAAPPMAPSQFMPVPTAYLAAQKGGTTPHGVPVAYPGMTPQAMPSAASSPSGMLAPPPAPSRAGLFVALGLVLVGAGGGAAWYFLAGPGKAAAGAGAIDSTGGVAKTAGTVDTGTRPVTSVPTPGGTAAVTPDAAAVRPVGARAGSILITSKPDGAAIFRGDERLGDTPFPLDLVVDETITLTLRRPGYEDGTQLVTGTTHAQKVKVLLKKEPRRASNASGATKPGSTGTTPGTGMPKPPDTTKPSGELKDMPGGNDDSEDLQ